MPRIKKVPLWVVVSIILIGLLFSKETFVPLTSSVAVAGLVVLMFSRGVDRFFGILLLVTGALLTVQEHRKSLPEADQEIVRPDTTR